MSMKAIAQVYYKLTSLLQAARVTGGSPYNGTAQDLANIEEQAVIFTMGTWTDGTHALKLQDSPDNSVWTDVVAADQVGTLTSITAGGQSNTVQQVGYIGNKRYLRPVITSSGTTTGAVIGVDGLVKRRKQP